MGKRKYKKIDFVKDEFKEDVQKEITIDEKLKSCEVDFTIEYKMPEFIIKIKTGNHWANVCSLGNFSCLTGAAKSRKSYTRFFFEACSLKNGMLHKTFFGKLPKNKSKVIYIDTEQAKENVSYAAQRIIKMSGVKDFSNYKVYALREQSYIERCETISDILKKNNDIGIMFIDGVADLASCNNDEVEGNRVAQLLMTWTSVYNIHIMTVIHQPRSHGGATGHLGAMIEKKAESIIGVRKDGDFSVIESKMLRNSSDFTAFPFEIIDNIPYLTGEKEEENNYEVNQGIEPNDNFNEIDEIPF